MPALYVVVASTICEYLKASDKIKEECVADTSYILIFLIPLSASFPAKIFTAFSVLLSKIYFSFYTYTACFLVKRYVPANIPPVSNNVNKICAPTDVFRNAVIHTITQFCG